jgi:hypothetical protein
VAMGASPVPPKRSEAEPAQPPNASLPYHHRIFVDPAPPSNPLSFRRSAQHRGGICCLSPRRSLAGRHTWPNLHPRSRN